MTAIFLKPLLLAINSARSINCLPTPLLKKTKLQNEYKNKSKTNYCARLIEASIGIEVGNQLFWAVTQPARNNTACKTHRTQCSRGELHQPMRATARRPRVTHSPHSMGWNGISPEKTRRKTPAQDTQGCQKQDQIAGRLQRPAPQGDAQL